MVCDVGWEGSEERWEGFEERSCVVDGLEEGDDFLSHYAGVCEVLVRRGWIRRLVRVCFHHVG